MNSGLIQRDEMIKAISPNKLIDGGAAILVMEKRNHHKVKEGANLKIPLIRKILRVEALSYVIFAMANRADEHKPCAIIITIAPCHPQDERIRIPRITRAICPMEE